MSATTNPREYPARPWVGIGVVLLRGEEVLLIRRGRAPRLGEWSLPGGGQRLGETAEDCARRELLEEAGVEAGPLRLLAVVDAITPGEAGRGPRFHYTIIDFAGAWLSGTARPGGDVTEVAWAGLDALEPFGLWPEAHRVITLARQQA
ncbi:NUDIX hydrolase [Falsiroseomonas sp.]|uniref:NUDIX hydrolase n=1 Tax=Falsiroseomonas sp. TaxID=2870721 RepID=UPI00271CD6FA|nr:NUDIX hydrolase [Falsiroseomonas sp.]MDO9502413.1 NUDIX hydrolase [Falsiroseomonas sp.]